MILNYQFTNVLENSGISKEMFYEYLQSVLSEYYDVEKDQFEIQSASFWSNSDEFLRHLLQQASELFGSVITLPVNITVEYLVNGHEIQVVLVTTVRLDSITPNLQDSALVSDLERSISIQTIKE